MTPPRRDDPVLIVAAIGGNALLRRGQPLDPDVQRENVRAAAAALADLAGSHRLAIVHGNGPQIGLLALQSEAYRDVRAYPLDILGAETEGMIGYLLEQELANALPEREIVALLTRVVVDAQDPAFDNPTKPIGPVYSEVEARRLASDRGWIVAPDGSGWRRVVASPRPQTIIELSTPTARRHGVEAVIDKDWSAAVLAHALRADALLLLTDVPAVELHWGTPSSRRLDHTSPAELAALRFEPGSMAPKVDAACWFVSQSGKRAVIGAISDAEAMLHGDAGTRIDPTSSDGALPASDG